ncbi:hypothetical protein OQA88_8498 [Cercophora sp. LCS_1]
MADTSLQDRLRESQKAFDGLLSLIPAKMYYGEEKSDQWMKKKQTKDQAKAAKRGKLDPDSELNRSAKEELEERARTKRKLREMEASDDESENESEASYLANVEREKPLEGLKKAKIQESSDDDEPSPKKAKVDEEGEKQNLQGPSVDPAATTNKKLTKEEKKSAKKAKKEEKLRAKLEKAPSKSKTDDTPIPKHAIQESTEVDEPDHEDSMMPMDISGLVPEEEVVSTGRSVSHSPVFDSAAATAGESAINSTGSTTSVSSTEPSVVPPRINLPKNEKDAEALKKRLEARLEALRASRKATDEHGKQIRTRQELIEQRREKQLKRKAHKRELRLRAKEEEDRKREEALASSRNSPLSMPTFNNPDDDRSANRFAFGRLAFSDGALMSHDLTYEKSADSKKKGPSDPKTALAKLEAQKKRLAALDEDKRKEVLEKETWLAARRRAEGEKVHDSEALLKKAVKRKDKAKKKSEKEWKERAAGVEKSIKDRQRKREENLKKRRDEKGAKGKKKKGGPTKPKNRPGFEGSFGGKRK